MAEYVISSGIPGIGKVSWGNHICHFYRSRAEAVESVVPYFAVGLTNKERCMLGAGAPFYADEVKAELARVVPDLEQRVGRGQISIFDHHEWDVANRGADAVEDLLQTEQKALADGYTGLRCGGNISWITRKDWKTFSE